MTIFDPQSQEALRDYIGERGALESWEAIKKLELQEDIVRDRITADTEKLEREKNAAQTDIDAAGNAVASLASLNMAHQSDIAEREKGMTFLYRQNNSPAGVIGQVPDKPKTSPIVFIAAAGAAAYFIIQRKRR